jgi:signal transduction histidine kinase
MKVDNEELALERVFSIGGKTGWYYANFLWKIRGFLDKLIGGVGLRRGRRNQNEAEKIFESKTIFADIAVSEQDGALYLSIAYPDEEMHYIYTEQTSSDKRLWGFFALDITLLAIAYGVLLNFLAPIKKLSKAIEKITDDDFAAMPVASKDEIGKLTESFNQTAVTLRKMLKDREAFAVRAAHELRTPIAKGRIAAEMDNGEYGELYRKIFKNLDIFTDELLKVHKLKNTTDIKNEKFSAETVLTAAKFMVFVPKVRKGHGVVCQS